MTGKIHFEIFVCKGNGPKAHWSLLEVAEQREAAITRAEALMRGDGYQGVRVTKETFNENTGKFFSVSIFEQGEKKKKKAKDDDDVIPCFKPQDLYSCHARETISSVLKDVLTHWMITPMELIHRADCLERLEASGTTLQHAIQKVAVAQAANSDFEVAEIMKKLQELITKALERVYKDDRAKAFVKINDNDLMTAYRAVKNAGEAEYRLAGSIAAFLADARSTSKKLSRLIKLAEALDGPAEDVEACIGVIDEFIAEMVKGNAALSDLLGDQPDLGTSLHVMSDLFLGKMDPEEKGVSEGARLLSASFKQNRFKEARQGLGRRILRELNGMRRLCPSDPQREVELMRRLATKLVMGQGPMMSIDEITDAFTNRSKRIVTDGWINDYLEQADNPDTRIDRLIALEENVVGPENKRKLTTFLVPIILDYKTEMHYLDSAQPPTRHLSRLAELQRKAIKTDFPELQKRSVAEALDQLSCRIETSANLIESIAKRNAPRLDKALMLLRLACSNTLTRGQCRDKARHAGLKMAKSTELAKSLYELREKTQAGDEAAKKKVEDFKNLLTQAEKEAKAQLKAGAETKADAA